ncbi:ADP-forming succinate--CoA ligase subunit beta [Cupriavidus agavae]|uniref:Succinate--CoA ligase [ADP-forming] subunit beta n=1 Tax=Cupriavidus agavae TaxID=1001822 RepID=A0A4Q7S381_9BURK|nr:ADP-forming succinate--CoA ligase subunit beta [Cupriavidus agavae]RZT39312.1 succinyl-CoA synthetase (ADP-forming) beta subunit [Cupriavidus agavae]
MNIHEHQAKELLRRYDLPVPSGCVVFTPDEAAHAARKLGGAAWVVKSQIHAGGRDAGRFVGDESGQGGVRVVTSLDQVQASAAQMLGRTLVTRQTGPAGRAVRRLYIEKACGVERELYLGIRVDHATARVTIVASTEGGMEIGDVAATAPGSLLKVAIDPASGIQPFHARRVVSAFGLAGRQSDAATRFVLSAYRAFTELDASVFEINPLAVTDSGEVMALDARFSFDDRALFRHPDIEAMRDESEEDPAQTEAARHALRHVRLDGSIAAIVNGAGMAMAARDLFRLHGAEPASLIEIGGSATPAHVVAAFRLALADPGVEGILVNLFGGMLRGDVVAQGVVAAVRELDITVPLVVRLEGTHADLGKRILRDAGLPIASASHLDDAAAKLVAAVRAMKKKGDR